MLKKLRCPFVDSPCIEELCMGWRNDHCFIDDVVPRLKPFKAGDDSIPIEQPPLPQIPSNDGMDNTEGVLVEGRHLGTTRKVSSPPIRLAIDLGTAYSKIAYRIAAEPIPIQIVGTEFLFGSDLVVDSDHISLAADPHHPNCIQDVKTKFRREYAKPCRGISGQILPLDPFEAVVYLYYVLIKRGLEELSDLPDIINITVPALAFAGSEDLQDRYREALVRAYALAMNIKGVWNAPLEIDRLRARQTFSPLPDIQIVSEPTAAVVDLVHEVPDEVFLIVDIGAGTTDIAIMGRFYGNDVILAEDTVTEGGRLLRDVFNTIAQQRFGISDPGLDSFHRLLRDESVRLNGQELTAEDLFDHPRTADWLESTCTCIKSVKKRAQDGLFVKKFFFVRSVSKNFYVSGGIGRSSVIRRRIFPERPEIPRRIPVPKVCGDWARGVGIEADDLYLQLAPAVGALGLHAHPMGEKPPPIKERPPDAGPTYDDLRGEGLR